MVITLPVLEDGDVQSHHGGSTAGPVRLTPPTPTFLLTLLTPSQTLLWSGPAGRGTISLQLTLCVGPRANLVLWAVWQFFS